MSEHREKSMKIAIVIGASSGMGKEFVKQLADWDKPLEEIWVIARRRERLEELRKESSCPLRILDGDLMDPDFRNHIKTLLRQERPCVHALVNSAGLGRSGSVWKMGIAQASSATKMTELNVTALTDMTQIVLPYMRAGSRILNLASASAFCPQPYFAVYAATKAYVLSFSAGLGQELLSKGIYVTAICPGPVDTEFFDHEGMRPSAWKKIFMSRPERVVKKALKDAARKKRVSVYGLSMKLFRFVTKLFPEIWIVRLTEILFRPA